MNVASVHIFLLQSFYMRSATSTTSYCVDSVLRMSFFFRSFFFFFSFVGGCQRVDGMNFNSYCEIVKLNHLWLLTALETQAQYAHTSCFAIRCLAFLSANSAIPLVAER